MAQREHAHNGLMVVEQDAGVAVVLSAAGTIDMVTAPQFQVHVDSVLSREPSALIIDLSRVEFLGSAGIGVLINVHNNAGDMAYAVAADGPATSRPLHLLGIGDLIHIYPSVADAIRELGLAAGETG
ncbi:STAS domain-containing protein [Mycobacterium cookii]|uniref:Anti-sigma factor antagonist n=1 Tax=Mycobacterium cookii TaxID=1775 RepID=A0A7I7KZG1_9MYCO|nr:STAS domain-containing protein [Mycobacterium cookii]BBX47263.1 anti-sigma factor antagonist [Mycobacterium cookii]